MDVVSQIKNGPMTRFQKLTIGVCMLIVIIDGYDIIVMALAAPFIAQEWGVDSINLGYLISAATAGMAAGSLLLAPLGDRFGRRNVTLLSLGIVSVGMIYSSLSQDVANLLASRAVTGVGIGAVIAIVGVITAEYSSKKSLGLTMALFSAGNGVGGFIGGLVAGVVIPASGWKMTFIIGAVASALLVLVAVAFLPESIDHLAAKRNNKSLQKLNVILRRMGREPIADLPAVTERTGTPAANLRSLFNPALLMTSVILMLGFGALMAAFYFNMGWTTKLVVDATQDKQLGLSVGTMLPFGGMIGGIVFGLVSLKIGNRILTTVSLVLAGAGAAWLAVSLDSGSVALLVPVIMAMGIGASIGGYYAVVPLMYPAQIRSSAFGWIIGFGRIVAIFTPIAAGYLLAAGWTGGGLFWAAAGLLILSAAFCLVLVLMRKTGHTDASLTEDQPAQDFRLEPSQPTAG